ncbi:MAG: MarR family transcriptional regulator [Vallitalea sp.]|jgi:DNA-binding MarR family transcriptional regulator|nr:MarR family transcriptional regulator [Vallitalea sp.]
MKKDDLLKLENQLCFPLYACSREIIKLYKPFLDKLDLTYTQYLTMMVLWEKNQLSVKELGNELYLDSGTLTPVLKKMESKGLLLRRRSSEDERIMIIIITEKGSKLKDKAIEIPHQVFCETHLEKDEAIALKISLKNLLNKMNN